MVNGGNGSSSSGADLSLSAWSQYTAYYKEALYIPEADEVVAIAALVCMGGKDIAVASQLMVLSDHGWGLWEEELRLLATNHTLPSWFMSSLRGGMRTELVLCGYAINPRLGELFGVGCNRWSRIQRLVLSSNPLGCQGAAGVAKGLTSPGNAISELVLDHCSIGDRGATALADALRTPMCGIQLLQLEENNIGDAGALALAGAFGASRYPLQLLLGGNCIGGCGCNALQTALVTSHRGALRLSSRFFPEQRSMASADGGDVGARQVWRSYATRSKRVEPLRYGEDGGDGGGRGNNNRRRQRQHRQQ